MRRVGHQPQLRQPAAGGKAAHRLGVEAEVGRKNVFVNVVSPGVIDTEMTAELPKEHVLPLIPLNRFGTSEEVAAVVDFLCTEPHMYVHGQVIGVNGGMAV